LFLALLNEPPEARPLLRKKEASMANQEPFENDPLRVEEKTKKVNPGDAEQVHPENMPSNANRYTERKKEDP
jgi:hypothetical protein